MAEELALAVRLERPSILLVVAATDEALARGRRELEHKVRAAGLTVQTVDVRRVPDGDLPMMLKQQAKRKHKVYFVRELERGGEPALRALNIRREYFTELRTRVVFWLTPNEEKQLAHYATDFWSIRHRTVHLSR